MSLLEGLLSSWLVLLTLAGGFSLAYTQYRRLECARQTFEATRARLAGEFQVSLVTFQEDDRSLTGTGLCPGPWGLPPLRETVTLSKLEAGQW